ncbi:hypothetical protein D3C81_948790 [compost metagenome]
MDAVPDVARQAGTAVGEVDDLGEQAARQLGITFELGGEHAPRGGDAGENRRRYLAQVPHRAGKLPGQRPAVVDIVGRAQRHGTAQVEHAAEAMVPGQPVKEYRLAVDQRLVEIVEIGRHGPQVAVRQRHALGHAGRPRGKQDPSRIFIAHRGVGRAHCGVALRRQFGAGQRGPGQMACCDLAHRNDRDFGHGQRIHRPRVRRTVLHEQCRRRHQFGHALQSHEVLAEQRVRRGNRRGRHAHILRRQQHHRLLDRIAGQQHQRTFRAQAKLQQARADGLHLPPHLAPAERAPGALAVAFAERACVGASCCPPGHEIAQPTLGRIRRGNRAAQQDGAVRAVLDQRGTLGKHGRPISCFWPGFGLANGSGNGHLGCLLYGLG